MAIKYTNFGYSTLAVGIGAGTTTLNVAGGHGARFPVLGVGDFFYATLENASTTREIVKVTARVVDAFTIVRAQDNTTASAWLAGDSVTLRFNAAAIETFTTSTGPTGSVAISTGTTAQRDVVPQTGYLRFNSTLTSFEGYNGSAWGSIGGGGGATGGGSDAVFFENDQTVTTDYTLTTGKNAMTAGPITINTGVTVTVPTGSVWTII